MYETPKSYNLTGVRDRLQLQAQTMAQDLALLSKLALVWWNLLPVLLQVTNPTVASYLCADLMFPLTQCLLNCERDDRSNKLIWPPYMIHHSTG